MSYAVEAVPPRVGRGHDPRACEAAAWRELLRVLHVSVREAAAIVGVTEADLAGVLCGRRRFVGAENDPRAAHTLIDAIQAREREVPTSPLHASDQIPGLAPEAPG